MDQLTNLLERAQNPDREIQQPAEKQLISFGETAYAEYLRALINVFTSEETPEQLRVGAVLEIKRLLTAQDDHAVYVKREQWNTLDPMAKNFVKEACIHGLSLSVIVGKQVAQIVEAVAKYEVPAHSWPTIVDQLIHAFDQVYAQDRNRIIAPLLAIGYFCGVAADSDSDINEQQINTILGKIAIGMDASACEDVQMAATQALSDTLDFAKHNMESKEDRDKIMGLVLSMTEPNLPSGTKEKAFQCLATVLQLYYHLLPEYMEKIWASTYAAIHSDDEKVAKQALNFWSEMCVEESDRSPDPNVDIADRNLGFIQKVQQPLCDLVLNYCLVKQDEDPDDDEKTDDTLYGGAEHCFVYLCSCLGHEILPPTFDYVQKNMMLPDWRRRQAAVFALGSVIMYNEPQRIAEVVNQTLPYVLQRMDTKQEAVASVRETAAWALANICSEGMLSIVHPNSMEPLLMQLLQSLQDKPRVAHMGATGIHALASAFSAHADEPTNKLSGQPFQALVTALWTTAQRADADQWQLMEDAYEALIKLVEVSGADMNGIVGNELLGHSLIRLQSIQEGKVHDTTGFLEVELCGVVISCCLKLKEKLLSVSFPPGTPAANNDQEAPAVADAIVRTMIGILQKPSSNAHADALQGIGEVINIVGNRFAGRYAEAVMPHVMRNLNVRQNAQVCIAAVRLLADIVTSMQGMIEPLVRGWMEVIFNNLQANDLQKEVKPPHLTIMGDIAEAVGPTVFRPYFQVSMSTCIQAFMYRVDITDDEYSAYLNELREASLESMELMLLDANPEDIEGFMHQIYELARTISLQLQDPRNYYVGEEVNCPPINRIQYRISDGIIKSMMGILGDVCQKMKGSFIQPLRQNESQLQALFEAGKASQNSDTRNTTSYTLTQIQQG